jgi:hypothetical protein
VLPEGYELAADFAALGDPRAKLTHDKLKDKGRRLSARVRCPKDFAACNDGRVKLRTAGKARRVKGARGRFTVAKSSFDDLAGGEKRVVTLRMKAKARRYFAERRRLAIRGEVTSTETLTPAEQRKNAVARKRRR